MKVRRGIEAGQHVQQSSREVGQDSVALFRHAPQPGEEDVFHLREQRPALGLEREVEERVDTERRSSTICTKLLQRETEQTHVSLPQQQRLHVPPRCVDVDRAQQLAGPHHMLEPCCPRVLVLLVALAVDPPIQLVGDESHEGGVGLKGRFRALIQAVEFGHGQNGADADGAAVLQERLQRFPHPGFKQRAAQQRVACKVVQSGRSGLLVDGDGVCEGGVEDLEQGDLAEASGDPPPLLGVFEEDIVRDVPQQRQNVFRQPGVCLKVRRVR
eukprot:768083-Hanusia_phi.AAC.2